MDVWQTYLRLSEQSLQGASEVVVDDDAVGWYRILIHKEASSNWDTGSVVNLPTSTVTE